MAQNGPLVVSTAIHGSDEAEILGKYVAGQDPHLVCVDTPDELWSLDKSTGADHAVVGLPGVPDERRFHSAYPQALVGNDLLRQLLREDFLIVEGEQGRSISKSDCIVLGHARGPQSRLHQCILVTSGNSPNRLEVALLADRKMTALQGRQRISGRKYTVLHSSVGTQMLHGKIDKVLACQGQANPFFLILTPLSVTCIAIHFQEFRRDAKLRVTELFTVQKCDLGERPPSSACLTLQDCLSLSVITKDGYLRTWTSKTSRLSNIRFRHSRTIHFELHHSSPGSLQMLVPNLTSRDSFFLIRSQQIILLDTYSLTFNSIYDIAASECILQVQPISTTPESDKHLYAVLSDRRVLIVAKGPSSPSRAHPTVAWKHYRSNVLGLNLHLLPARGTRISLLLYDGSSGLCTIYHAEIMPDQMHAYYPARLNLGSLKLPTTLLPYDCAVQAESCDANNFGLFCLTRDGTVTSTIFGDSTSVSYQFERVGKIIGPALVEDDIESEDLNDITSTKHVVTSTLDDGCILDLGGWYRELSKGDQTSNSQRPATVQAEGRLSGLLLGHEVFDVVDRSIEGVDSAIESLVLSHHASGRYADTTPGLRLNDHQEADRHDTERYSAQDIHSMLRTWHGQRLCDRRLHPKSPWVLTDAVLGSAAKSLALSTIVFSESHASTVLDVLKVTQLRRNKKLKNALNSIIDEWNLIQDPSNYAWREIGTRKASVKQVGKMVLQSIPAYSGPQTLPPVIARSRAGPPNVSSTQGRPMSSQGDSGIIMTQPVPGRFGGDRTATKRVKKKAGF